MTTGIDTCGLCQCTRYPFGVGFVGRGCVDYPDELESVLRDTATTGIVRYVDVSHTYHWVAFPPSIGSMYRLQWDLLCPILHYRLEKV